MSRYSIKEKKPTVKYVLSEEVAQEQVVDFLAYYNIDLDKLDGNKADEASSLKVLERACDKIRDYIREGVFQIRRDKDEKLEIVQTLSNGQSVVYLELGANAKLAQDKYPREAHYQRFLALFGSLSSLGSDAIKKFPRKDLEAAETLGSLFTLA